MSTEQINALIRTEQITEEQITAEMAASSSDRATAVRKLFALGRANKIAAAMTATPAPVTPEQTAQLDARRAQVEAMVAERRTKDARVTELRGLIAAAAANAYEQKCALYAELVTLL